MKKGVVIALISIIIVGILAVGGFFIWKLNEKIDEQNDKISKLTNEISNTESATNVVTNSTYNNVSTNSMNTNSTNAVNNTTTNSTSNTITNTTNNTTSSSAFEDDEIKEIKSAFELLLSRTYSKYKIDSIRILNESEKQEVITGNNKYKTTDILAYINFSIVKADSENPDEWLPYKNICVAYRDGQIVNFGTSW